MPDQFRTLTDPDIMFTLSRPVQIKRNQTLLLENFCQTSGPPVINSFPTTDVYTRVYYHPSDRID
jgi:myo-inositol catabolism protein IolC